jgi:D-3-phosphoglycerate dehydrogenase
LGPILAWGRDTSAAKARAAGYDFAASKADQFERSRHRPGRLGTDETDVPSCQHVSRWGYPGALLTGLRNCRPGYAAATGYEKEPVASGNRPLLLSVLCTPHLGRAEWDNFELYFRGRIEVVGAYPMGAAADQELELTAGRRSRSREKFSLPAYL